MVSGLQFFRPRRLQRLTARLRSALPASRRTRTLPAHPQESEAALRTSEEWFKALVQHAVDLITVVDASGTIRYISPSVERMGGYTVEELIGKRMADLVHPEDLATMVENHRMRLAAPGVPILGTTRFRAKDGRWLHIEGYGTNLLDNPAIGGIVLNSRDVTERRQVEEALARSNDELQQFAYVASHDLQEPLRMVASFAQLLAREYEGRLGPEADDYIGFIVDGAKRMQQLIQDLLAYSRVDRRGASFAPVELETVLEQALANLAVAIEEQDARVTQDPLPCVHGDGRQLVQVFQNLIGNAVKFRGTEAPAIHISAAEQDDAWVVSVCDNGIGIDPAHADQIFTIFQRLHTRAEYPGTGIGLAICKKVVERHGGRIWVESRPGDGAAFRFTLPVHGGVSGAEPPPRSAVPTEGRRSGGGPPRDPSGAREHPADLEWGTLGSPIHQGLGEGVGHERGGVATRPHPPGRGQCRRRTSHSTLTA